MKKIHLSLSFFIVLLLVSCSSSDEGSGGDNPVDELTTEEKLAFKWQLEVYSIDGGSNSVDECSRNNTIEFFSNGNYEELNNYGTPCISEVSTGTWEFSNGFLFTLTGGEIKYDILELNETTLKIEYTSEFMVQGEPMTTLRTFTYSRI